MAGYLIKETTCEERKQIVEEALGNLSASCDGCMAGLADMYQDYIDGKKEIPVKNASFRIGAKEYSISSITQNGDHLIFR